MRLLPLAKSLRDGAASCLCCGRYKDRLAPFAVPSADAGEGFLAVYICTGCLRAALEVARDGLKREGRS